MAKALTAVYTSLKAAQNARDDLIGTGYPSEKIHVQKDACELWLLTPSDTEREAREILERHDPREVKEADVPDT